MNTSRIRRRQFLGAGSLACVTSLLTRVAHGRIADESVTPNLAPKSDVTEKLAALKPNQAVVLGRAEVKGDFNDTARKYELHKTGPNGRDFTIKMCWAADRKRALFCGANHGVPHRRYAVSLHASASESLNPDR